MQCPAACQQLMLQHHVNCLKQAGCWPGGHTILFLSLCEIGKTASLLAFNLFFWNVQCEDKPQFSGLGKKRVFDGLRVLI